MGNVYSLCGLTYMHGACFYWLCEWCNQDMYNYRISPPSSNDKAQNTPQNRGVGGGAWIINPRFVFSLLFPKTVEEVLESIERLTFTTPHFVDTMTVNQSASTISHCLKHRQGRCLYWVNFRWKHRLYEESAAGSCRALTLSLEKLCTDSGPLMHIPLIISYRWSSRVKLVWNDPCPLEDPAEMHTH